MVVVHGHRAVQVAAVAAALALTAASVVVEPAPTAEDHVAAATAGASAATAPAAGIEVLEGRAAQRASRSGLRPPTPTPTAAATARPAPASKPSRVTATRYATVALNVRTGPSTGSDVVDVLAVGHKVAVIGRARDGWQPVAHQRQTRWVKASFLAAEPPTREAMAKSRPARGGLSGAPCPHGSAVERGLSRNAVAVHRAVCARWPEITSFGGLRAGSGSNHNTGHALDVMVRGSRGDQVAAWLRDNAKALGITELIWEQRIWTSQRSGDGWRHMSNRGSATANHFDHVHVSVA
jgi:uncharacterized protein YgiM (DUF1202 family)